MATTKYLDYQGLAYFWEKIKKYVGDGVGSIFAWQRVTGADASDPTSSTTYTADSTSNTLQFVNGSNIQTTLSKDANSGAIKVTTKAKDVVTNVSYSNGNLQKSIDGGASTTVVSASTIVSAGKATVIQIGEGGTTGSSISKCQAFNAFQIDRDFARKTDVSALTNVKDCNPTLAWGKTCEVATVGNCTIHVTMPANPNTDTRVTCAANHYTPTGSVTLECNDGTGVAGASVSVITGITTDSKGHVTAASYAKTTDTRNTAGSTNDTGCLFIIGALSQADNPQTFSNSQAYIKAGKVYSNGLETVTLGATQTLTNKTLTGAKASTNPAASCSSTTLATTKYVTDAVATAVTGAVHFKGTITPGVLTTLTNYKAGWYWLVKPAAAFSDFGNLQEGDQIYAIANGASYSASNFTVIQANLDPMTTSEIDDATDKIPNAG